MREIHQEVLKRDQTVTIYFRLVQIKDFKIPLKIASDMDMEWAQEPNENKFQNCQKHLRVFSKSDQAFLNGEEIYQHKFDMIDSTDIVAKRQANMAKEIYYPQNIERFSNETVVDFRHKFLHVPSWRRKNDENVKVRLSNNNICQNQFYWNINIYYNL